MNKDKINGSGCYDPTAYEALKNINDEKRVNQLIKTIFYIVNLAGFRVDGRIVLQDKKTGKIWR